MRFSLAPESPTQVQADLLAIPVSADALIDTPLLAHFDTTLDGALSREVRDCSFRAKPAQVLLLNTMGLLPARRVALVGVGSRRALDTAAIRQYAATVARQGKAKGAATIALLLPEPGPEAAPVARTIVEGVLLGAYKFDKYRSADPSNPPAPEQILLLSNASPGDAIADQVAAGVRRANAILWARDLVNEPAGCLTPTALADAALALAQRHALATHILGPRECAEQGMNLLLAVSQGSPQEPRLVHLAWKPPLAHRKVVLVGKGITFDSGGLSLKPSASMLDMKTDMAGAAAVLAAMAVIVEEELPIEVHAVAACAENMISGTAYKLGDVLRSKAGKTVEITNTDAEGRLALADALAYARTLSPDVIVDLATLTGACVVALGPHIAGVMGNSTDFVETWLAAGRTAGEQMWHLPLSDTLNDQLKSDIADLKNSGDRWGGALTAGLFLKEFVGDLPWLHVDIAGPSASEKENGHIGKGGTGFGIASILEFLTRLLPSSLDTTAPQRSDLLPRRSSHLPG